MLWRFRLTGLVVAALVFLIVWTGPEVLWDARALGLLHPVLHLHAYLLLGSVFLAIPWIVVGLPFCLYMGYRRRPTAWECMVAGLLAGIVLTGIWAGFTDSTFHIVASWPFCFMGALSFGVAWLYWRRVPLEEPWEKTGAGFADDIR